MRQRVDLCELQLPSRQKQNSISQVIASESFIVHLTANVFGFAPQDEVVVCPDIDSCIESAEGQNNKFSVLWKYRTFPARTFVFGPGSWRARKSCLAPSSSHWKP